MMERAQIVEKAKYTEEEKEAIEKRQFKQHCTKSN